MNILITGASSKIGRLLLEAVIQISHSSHIYIVSRNSALQADPVFSKKNITLLCGDLSTNQDFLDQLPPINLCIHLAAITHSLSEEDYLLVNYQATINLAQRLIQKNVSDLKFCFISSQVAGENAGSYALSKYKAEKELLKMDLNEVIILRPSEVIGMNSKEGLDKFFNLAKKFRIFPWLLHWHPINFSPIQAEDLIHSIITILFNSDSKPSSKSIYLLRGALVSSSDMAKLLFTRYYVLPIPIFIPLLKLFLNLLKLLGIKVLPPDQLPRLLGERNQKPAEDIKLIDYYLATHSSNNLSSLNTDFKVFLTSFMKTPSKNKLNMTKKSEP